MPEKLLIFLAAARDQARDLRRRCVAELIVSRRRQTYVVITCAFITGVITFASVRGAQHARATWSTCPTLVPSPTDGTSAGRAAVPTDWRVVALPRDVIAPDLRPGDLVDLVSQAETVASRAIVVTAAGENTGLNVAVAPDAAPLVATAAQTGDISILALG